MTPTPQQVTQAAQEAAEELHPLHSLDPKHCHDVQWAKECNEEIMQEREDTAAVLERHMSPLVEQMAGDTRRLDWLLANDAEVWIPREGLTLIRNRAEIDSHLEAASMRKEPPQPKYIPSQHFGSGGDAPGSLMD